MMNTQDQGKVKPSGAWSRAILHLCVWGGGLMFGLGVSISVITFVQYRRPIPAPKYQISTARLLRSADEDTRQHAVKIDNRPTSASIGAKKDGDLKYEPMIPDTPDIPPALKALARELNERFDGRMKRIAYYERIKHTLTPQEAIRTIKSEIHLIYDEAWTRIKMATEYKLTNSGGQKVILDRHMEYLKWYYPALIEAQERAHDWDAASSTLGHYDQMQFSEWERRQWPETAIWTETCLFNRDEWERQQQQWGQKPMPPRYRSDYDRQTGNQYYNQSLYYLRKRGDLWSYLDMSKLFWEPKIQALEDRFRRIQNGEPSRPAQ